MKSYEDIELPVLPEPWGWEKGEDDGDPCAMRRERGWYTRVHEARACGYHEDLVVTARPDHHYEGAEPPIPPHGIPFSVYAAVHQALVTWYEVDPPEPKPAGGTPEFTVEPLPPASGGSWDKLICAGVGRPRNENGAPRMPLTVYGQQLGSDDGVAIEAVYFGDDLPGAVRALVKILEDNS